MLSRSSGIVTTGSLTPIELTKVSITILIKQGEGTIIIPSPSVEFVCHGQPNGVNVQFDPNPLTVPWDAMPHTTVMTATTESMVQQGIYDLTILAIVGLDKSTTTKEAHYQLVIPSVPGFDIGSIALGLGLGISVLIVMQRRRYRIVERSNEISPQTSYRSSK
jgi:hypothetical protein